MADEKKEKQEPSSNALMDQMQEILDLYGIQIEKGKANEVGEDDLVEVLSKTQDKIEDLNKQADQIAAGMGMSRDDLEAFANNPDNFSQEQWEVLQRVRQECDSFRDRTVKSLEQAGAEARGEPAPEAGKKKKQKKKFGKKKKWLQM